MSDNITKEEIISFILECVKNDISISATLVKQSNPKLYNQALKEFGSWKNTIEAAGVEYKSKQSKYKWTKEDIIKKLRELDQEDLVDKELRIKHSGLYYACLRLFGSRKNAIEAAGLDYEGTLTNIPWTRDRIISTIQMFHLSGLPLNFKYINSYHSRLKKRAEKFFDSWGDAVEAAGLDYEEIKKSKGWSKPFLAEDGQLYTSKVQGLVANELLQLRKEKKIIDYKTQQFVTPGKNWTCDFVVKLINGADFWLEVDSVDRKKNEDLEDRMDFYEKGGFLYYKVSSSNNIQNIIDRYTNWYSLPLKNSLITAHKNPDGDALSSARAVYNYLLSNGKRACIKFAGEIPKNLMWILDGVEEIKKIPEWVENIIVLDCAPSNDRVGWEMPELSIYNIDHHESRIQDNDPDNDIHVINSCSTASILLNRFGIKDDILAIGVYTDTLFTKSFNEFMRFLYVLDMSEEKLSAFVSKINSSPKKLWKILKESKVHRCRNGFTIVETGEDTLDTIESLMQILSKLSESVCLIYGKDNMVKLRTSNPNLDLSIIAKEYSGGGHPYASMCNVAGKISEFKNKIRAIDVPEIEIVIDGYE